MSRYLIIAEHINRNCQTLFMPTVSSAIRHNVTPGDIHHHPSRITSNGSHRISDDMTSEQTPRRLLGFWAAAHYGTFISPTLICCASKRRYLGANTYFL